MPTSAASTNATKKGKKDVEVELSRQERALRHAFDALETLKGHPLTEAERARLTELHAKIMVVRKCGFKTFTPSPHDDERAA